MFFYCNVFGCSVKRVTQLLAAGVEVNLLDSPDSRNTPLHWAVTYGNKDVVQCLCSTLETGLNRFSTELQCQKKTW